MDDAGDDTGGSGGELDVHAVVRTGWSDRARTVMGGAGETEREGGTVPTAGGAVGYRMVLSGKIAAAVTAWPAGAARRDEDTRRRIHERVVEALLGHRSVVPLPYRCTAPGEDAVRRLLARSRLPLEEALDTVHGCYELRLHALDLPDPSSWEGTFGSLASRARAARRLPPPAGARASAAFLLPRDRWVAFVEEIADREARSPGTVLDVTGPWAPYDFVRFREPPTADSPGE